MTEFSCATKIITGEGALSALGQLKAERVLVVTDMYFSQNGTARRIGAMVPNAEVQVFDQVKPDPTVELAAAGAALCTKFCPQVLLALGGGSPIDCAKAILAACESRPLFVAIPTTSGSGSEVTSFSVLTKGNVKIPLVDSSMRPDIAILDASLLRSMPQKLLADTGMDLIAHSLEALAAKGRNPMSTALASAALSAALRDLGASYAGDESKRQVIHDAACMAGIAFDSAGLGVCHAVAHALGARLHIPHGRLCAMLLPHVLTVNLEGAEAAYRHAALACGLTAPTGKIAVRSLSLAIGRLRSQLQMPASLREAGVDLLALAGEKDGIVKSALEDACCRGNPVPVTAQMVRQLLQAVCG